jgi:patatin-like phospholipase/acyl hydrolase
MPPLTRDQHLFTPSPKRILALEGGGVRGIISLAYLERLEALLRERIGPDLVLADYFDLIGGTSGGAIMATGLALGMPVAKLIDIYFNLASKGFRRTIWSAYWAPKFRAGPLLEQIREQVGVTTLGSTAIRTGLAIVAKRIDTGSVWVFHNHPNGPFFDPHGRDPDAVPNKDLLLSHLLRASTAAPTYFAPDVRRWRRQSPQQPSPAAIPAGHNARLRLPLADRSRSTDAALGRNRLSPDDSRTHAIDPGPPHCWPSSRCAH